MSQPASLPFTGVGIDLGSGRSGDGRTPANDDYILVRLALWLAGVAAEAVVAPPDTIDWTPPARPFFERQREYPQGDSNP